MANLKLTLILVSLITVLIVSGCVSKDTAPTGDIILVEDIEEPLSEPETPSCPENCSDGLDSTRDYCSKATNYECAYEEMQKLCSDDIECDDDNPCTADTCVNEVCYNIVISTTSCENVKETSFYGEVISVLSGDTFQIETGDLIQLAEIESPQESQKYFSESTKYLEQLILDKEVRIVWNSENNGFYVYVQELKDSVNYKMLKEGYATVSSLNTPNVETYESAQRKAQAAKIGIWKSFNLVYAVINVHHVSDVSREYINLEYNLWSVGAPHSLDLTGWVVSDENGNQYIFTSKPKFDAQHSLRIHTRKGRDETIRLEGGFSRTDFYWGREESVWEKGETLFLINPDGFKTQFKKV